MTKTIEKRIDGIDNNPIRLLGESIMGYVEKFAQSREKPCQERSYKLGSLFDVLLSGYHSN